MFDKKLTFIKNIKLVNCFLFRCWHKKLLQETWISTRWTLYVKTVIICMLTMLSFIFPNDLTI